MRVARAGYVRFALAVGTIVGLATVGGAPAAAWPQPQAPTHQRSSGPGFRVTIYPAYTTAGQPTTFEVTIANTSPRGTALRSFQLTPPTGFKLSRPAPNAPLRRKTRVLNRTLSVRQLSLAPGSKVRIFATATAPAKCGKSPLRWTSRAFQGGTPAGPQLTFQSALSSVGVTVACPAAAACGDGGPPCSTSLTTSTSVYGVVSNASAGTLRGTVDVGRPLTCGKYRFRDPNWYDSAVTPPSAPPPSGAGASIVDVVSYTIKNAGSQGIGFCLGATYEFVTASGQQARAGKLPTGAPGFIGLLPMCTAAAPPCISTISQRADSSVKSGFDAVMTIQIPEQGDPWGGA
jgi:hypothetical protein